MKYTIFYKLWNDTNEYIEHAEGEDAHQLLRDCMDRHNDLREISIIAHKREAGRGKVREVAEQ